MVITSHGPRHLQDPATYSHYSLLQYLKPGEIVVVVSQRGNAGMLFQADSGFYFRLAGGYVNMSLSQQDPQPVAALTHPTRDALRQFQDYIREAGVGAILVEQAWAEPWMSVFSRVGMHGTQVGGVTIYPAVNPMACGLCAPGPMARLRRGVAVHPA